MPAVSTLDRALEYRCSIDLDVYDSPKCDRLATQAATGRHIRIVSLPVAAERAIAVRLCEDDYPGWLAVEDAQYLEPAPTSYRAPVWSAEEIQRHIPEVVAFTYHAMEHHDRYLWGGTVGPNYDCSGLMQAAFASVGVRLPRDAYQQEAFVRSIPLNALQTGDLVFFGTPEKATHVGLYLGDGRYIHSSGIEQGRNGIAIDILSPEGDDIARNYYQQFRGAGRVVASYQPQPG
ncbi:MAG TPA: C40 family peptidase [Oscillatoriales cyanobacterium M59_W2019_021]|nr:MAG: NlpC/P60 family protein [Cyanobacteria bacterium J055]HIK30038.1 C40 family peptidase [Oscillatoriales cyanobacterium M4454_W2019_049]HIK50393.1 C40 family peptidase [Oscillatoriales cyanobacterium M59_W2019_021]